MKRIVLLLAAMLALSTFALSDIPRPETSPRDTPKPNSKKTIDAGMQIRLDATANEARLLIPKSQIQELRAALEDLDSGSDNTAATTATGFSRVQTIMTGLFMSLAIVFGGIWFTRSGKASSKTAKTAVIALAITAIGTAATFVYANAGPPPYARRINGSIFSDDIQRYGSVWGTVKLGVSDSNGIQLIIPNTKDAKPSGEE